MKFLVLLIFFCKLKECGGRGILYGGCFVVVMWTEWSLFRGRRGGLALVVQSQIPQAVCLATSRGEFKDSHPWMTR
jgi:hypothetical protein